MGARARCRADPGHWRIHANTGTGFAAAPIPLELPTGYPPDTLPQFVPLDLDRDGLTDLVLDHPVDDATADVGTTHWLLHPGRCLAH